MVLGYLGEGWRYKVFNGKQGRLRLILAKLIETMI